MPTNQTSTNQTPTIMIIIIILMIMFIIIIIIISFSEPTILGFNEPNHADQSNLDPETAAYSWLELQQAYPDKVCICQLCFITNIKAANIKKTVGKSAKGETDPYQDLFGRFDTVHRVSPKVITTSIEQFPKK